MKNKASTDLNQAPPTLLDATDFYDLKSLFPMLDEEQLRDRPFGNLAGAFKMMLLRRTNSELRAAAAELERVIEPLRDVRGLTTRFRALLYVLINADLASINGFPAATEDELIAVLGLLLLQEYLQISESQTSGQQSLDSLKEHEAQVFEAWACASNMSKIQQRIRAGYYVNYGDSVPAKFKSVSVQGRLNAIQKNAVYRDLEREVIKRFTEGREEEGHPIFGKWKSAKDAGERICAEMKAAHEKSAKENKKSGDKDADFPLEDSNAEIQMGVYIRHFLKKEKASEALAKLGIASTWNPDKNEFVPHLNS